MTNWSWQRHLRCYPNLAILDMIQTPSEYTSPVFRSPLIKCSINIRNNLTFLDPYLNLSCFFSVLLFDPKTHQPQTRGRSFLLCQQCDPTDLRNHGQPLPGAPRRGLLPLHCLLWRERVRIIINSEDGVKNKPLHLKLNFFPKHVLY